VGKGLFLSSLSETNREPDRAWLGRRCSSHSFSDAYRSLVTSKMANTMDRARRETSRRDPFNIEPLTMEIVQATRAFESWLAERTVVVRSQLSEKHRRMAENPLAFLRGTIYRWAQIWREALPEAALAPRVLAVGDLHVESFGTWRDLAGRLIWGVDDFDEASYLPYVQDLLRLAVSARLAVSEEKLSIGWKDACDAILEGYRDCLRYGGDPFVLEEKHRWLRRIALQRLDDPRPFWDKLLSNPPARKPVASEARQALKKLLPEPGLPFRLSARSAGLGSLGHRRFVALADWRGGKLALEAKALVPSAFHWVLGEQAPVGIYYQTLLDKSVRAQDPFVRLCRGWIVRQLSPDSSPVELASLPKKQPEERLLRAMGWEAANIHLASPKAIPAIKSDLKTRPAGWLRSGTRELSGLLVREWKEWRRHCLS
jgi:Uncharacterized protein conserved in bacteria (DUF2252)